MTSEDMSFSAFSDKNVTDLRAAKQEWSQKLIAGTEGVFSASSSRTKIVSTKPNQNVVGVGIGEKVTEGASEGILSVKFFVRVKYPKAELSKADLLPETIDGLPVDVEETGTFRAQAMPNPRTRMRPAKPGSSVGFADPAGQFVMAGTFGALVKKDNKLFILSNNHVLADENRLALKSDIFQPGLLDGGNALNDKIAKLSKFITLLPGVFNKVDAAIAEVNKKSDVSSSILFIGAPTGTKKAALDMSVHKFGRTTRYTVGKVVSIDTDVKVSYDIGDLSFSDQIIIVGDNSTSFSDSGDSGSLILERSTQKAVGLLFAGSKTHTIANHISEVTKALKVQLA
jgi:hypothetical protein